MTGERIQKIHTINYGCIGTPIDVCEQLNKDNITQYFHSIVVHDNNLYVILVTTNYPDYLRLCEKLMWTPMSSSEYFQ